jgi:hypothetical protein
MRVVAEHCLASLFEQLNRIVNIPGAILIRGLSKHGKVRILFWQLITTAP